MTPSGRSALCASVSSISNSSPCDWTSDAVSRAVARMDASVVSRATWNPPCTKPSQLEVAKSRRLSSVSATATWVTPACRSTCGSMLPAATTIAPLTRGLDGAGIAVGVIRSASSAMTVTVRANRVDLEPVRSGFGTCEFLETRDGGEQLAGRLRKFGGRERWGRAGGALERADLPGAPLPDERDDLRAPRLLRLDRGAAADDPHVPDCDRGRARREALDPVANGNRAKNDHRLGDRVRSQLRSCLRAGLFERLDEPRARRGRCNAHDDSAKPHRLEQHIAVECGDRPSRSCDRARTGRQQR